MCSWIIRFEGSSFKAMGNQNKVQGEWAIVGGTGVFTFARGTISIYRIQGDWFSNIKEIRISAFCPKIGQQYYWEKYDIYYVWIHSKSNVSKKVKTSYNLEWI